MNDTSSLQNLNDIVAPAAVPWWPLAPGWYVLMAITFMVILWFAMAAWRRWQQNRYRRQALEEFSAICKGPEGALHSLPELLKRTALSAWPRDEVAALSGERWHRFLDESAGVEQFCGGAGELLDQLAYGDGRQPGFSEEEQRCLVEATENWLRSHRHPAGTGP